MLSDAVALFLCLIWEVIHQAGWFFHCKLPEWQTMFGTLLLEMNYLLNSGLQCSLLELHWAFKLNQHFASLLSLFFIITPPWQMYTFNNQFCVLDWTLWCWNQPGNGAATWWPPASSSNPACPSGMENKQKFYVGLLIMYIALDQVFASRWVSTYWFVKSILMIIHWLWFRISFVSLHKLFIGDRGNSGFTLEQNLRTTCTHW